MPQKSKSKKKKNKKNRKKKKGLTVTATTAASAVYLPVVTDMDKPDMEKSQSLKLQVCTHLQQQKLQIKLIPDEKTIKELLEVESKSSPGAFYLVNLGITF